MAEKLTSKENTGLRVRFIHPDINLLSDRTYTSLNKGCRKICSEIILRVVDSFLKNIELPLNYKQSIKDRVIRQLNEFPTYYLVDVKKGSFEITADVYYAAGIWLILTILAGDIKTAWSKTKTSQKFREFLTTEINLKNVKKIFFPLKDTNAKIPEILSNEILSEFPSKIIENRFFITEITKEYLDNNIVVTIKIKTSEEIEKKIKIERIKTSDINSKIDQIIDFVEDEFPKE
jgi:hypothetical protein